LKKRARAHSSRRSGRANPESVHDRVRNDDNGVEECKGQRVLLAVCRSPAVPAEPKNSRAQQKDSQPASVADRFADDEDGQNRREQGGGPSHDRVGKAQLPCSIGKSHQAEVGTVNGDRGSQKGPTGLSRRRHKSRTAPAIAPPPVTRRVVSTSLLSPDLMKAFHAACRSAANSTINMTWKDTVPCSSLHCLRVQRLVSRVTQ